MDWKLKHLLEISAAQNTSRREFWTIKSTALFLFLHPSPHPVPCNVQFWFEATAERQIALQWVFHEGWKKAAGGEFNTAAFAVWKTSAMPRMVKHCVQKMVYDKTKPGLVVGQ